ncbi:MAG TPA: hypothetical protein VM368_04405 [Flavisolibacter sp.]|nr:hypothetical protein [Flavisolibacter sp.]
MQGEFEKQVQGKLDELKLTPTEPVWEHIESAIRKKRNRRRLFIWLPLLFITTGGGMWLFIDKEQSDNSTAKHPNSNTITTTESASNKKKLNTTEATDHSENTESSAPEISQRKSSVTTGNNNKAPEKEIIYATTITKKNENQIRSAGRESVKTVVPTQSEDIQLNTANTPKSKSVISKGIAIDSIKKQQTASSQPLLVQANETILFPNQPATDSISETQVVAIKKSSRWILGVQTSIGISGIGNGFPSLLKSMDANFSLPQSGGTGTSAPFYAPSEIKKGLSLSFGASVKKEWSKKVSLTTGLQYNYYSTSIKVGSIVRNDTVIQNNQNQIRIASYYRNAPSGLQDHTNQYHFISIPVGVDFKLLRQAPLKFHLGLALQQLVHTNALHYEPSMQIYYPDKNAFTKTQLFSNIALNYSFPAGEKIFSVGPEMQYGLSRLIKEGNNAHLFAFGIKGQIFFSKK